MGAPRYRTLFVLLLVVLALPACSPESGGGGGGTTSAGGAAGLPRVPKDAPRVPALSGVEEAERVAAGWRKDAELYAISSFVPRVDAGGRAPAWLYTYVSRSAGAVASVSITGGKAELLPEQKLPEGDIENIAGNTLPPPEELVDSTQAIKKAPEVRKLLNRNPETAASAGLDSFSSEEPIWIFSTARDTERVEERVPATRGS